MVGLKFRTAGRPACSTTRSGLYVYYNDKRVAKSDALVATAQGVGVPFNGTNPNGNFTTQPARASTPNHVDHEVSIRFESIQSVKAS